MPGPETANTTESPTRLIRTILAALAVFAVGAAGCSLHPPIQPDDVRREPVDLLFDAPTYADFGAFRRGQPRTIDYVPAKLWLPPGSGKVPAVVVAHSIGGWNDNGEGQYVQPLLDAGYAVLRLNHFAGRGIKRAADIPNAINPATTASDALLALKALAAHPRIDAARVGIMGLSLGGFTSELAAYEFTRRRVLGDSELRFAAHVPFYGPCSIMMSSVAGTLMAGGPVLRLLGEKDELSTRENCETIARRIKQIQPDAVFDSIWYPAHHAWDIAVFQPARFFPNHVSRKACPVADFGGRMPVHVLADGQTRPFDPAADAACRARSAGYTMGYDADTTEKARQAMLSFFNEHLKK